MLENSKAILGSGYWSTVRTGGRTGRAGRTGYWGGAQNVFFHKHIRQNRQICTFFHQTYAKFIKIYVFYFKCITKYDLGRSQGYPERWLIAQVFTLLQESIDFSSETASRDRSPGYPEI